jgi:serine/threonine-protein kinase
MNGCRHRLFAAVLAAAALAVPCRAADEKARLAGQARLILEKNCYRCHGQNGSNDGGFNYVLDFQKLVGKKVVAGDPEKSRLFRRMGVNRTMPPEDEKQRPTDADITVVKKWIEAGAPAPAVVAADRPFLTDKDVLQAVRDHLKRTPRDERRFQRYFTLTHLHNQPAARVKDADLRVYRAALAKLVNSLSWKKDLVLPEAADAAGTVLAVDLRRLDWDQAGLWREILNVYPYGLKHDHLPDDSAVNELAEEVAELAGTDLPAVRADWFLAAAGRPPLYHTLLQLPKNARDLERRLDVDVADNFDRGLLARAAFNGSGVSG